MKFTNLRTYLVKNTNLPSFDLQVGQLLSRLLELALFDKLSVSIFDFSCVWLLQVFFSIFISFQLTLFFIAIVCFFFNSAALE